jgi:hypothetical protein
MNKGLVIALVIAGALGIVLLVYKGSTSSSSPNVIETVNPGSTGLGIGSVEGLLTSVGNNVEGLLGVTPQASGPTNTLLTASGSVSSTSAILASGVSLNSDSLLPSEISLSGSVPTTISSSALAVPCNISGLDYETDDDGSEMFV